MRKPTYNRAIALIRQRVIDAEIARRTGYSRERIRQLRVRMGIPCPPHPHTEKIRRLMASSLADPKFMKQLKSFLEDERCYNDLQISQFLRVPKEIITLL